MLDRILNYAKTLFRRIPSHTVDTCSVKEVSIKQLPLIVIPHVDVIESEPVIISTAGAVGKTLVAALKEMDEVKTESRKIDVDPELLAVKKLREERSEFRASQSPLVVLDEPDNAEIAKYVQPIGGKPQFSTFEREKIHTAINLFHKAARYGSSSFPQLRRSASNLPNIDSLSAVFDAVYKLKSATDAKSTTAFYEIMKGNVAIGFVDGEFTHFVTLKKVFSDTYHQMSEEQKLLALTPTEATSTALAIVSKYGYSPFDPNSTTNRIMAAHRKNANEVTNIDLNRENVDNSDILTDTLTFQYMDGQQSTEHTSRSKTINPGHEFDLFEPDDETTLMDKLDTKFNSNIDGN